MRSRSTSPSFREDHTMPRPCIHRFERYCCSCISYFPLVIVYALTGWAVWVQYNIGVHPPSSKTPAWTGKIQAFVGVLLFILLNWSYTTAVFTSPGSTTSATGAQYASLPANEAGGMTSFTVKSNGEVRFCKKCNAKKPDRAHHCSSCGRCVLKMDHHCPWLAACVGFRNYKPFLLFLIYTCLFCYLCLAAAATWVWKEIVHDVHFGEDLMPVNYILLSILAGVIGLVLGGFTAWHIYLASKGQTTIESLEKTRYLSPMKRAMQRQMNGGAGRHYVDQRMGEDVGALSEQLAEIHANAIPGVTRDEEGEALLPSTGSNGSASLRNSTATSPAKASLQQNHNSYQERERQRESDRYNDYLDEQDLDKLPHAFDLGWRRNLKSVFGPNPLLWFFPVFTTIGDGFRWQASQKWLDARDDLSRQRAERARENAAFESERGWSTRTALPNFRSGVESGLPQYRARSPLLNAPPRGSVARKSEEPNYESDEEDLQSRKEKLQSSQRVSLLPQGRDVDTANWNDLPEDFKTSGRRTPGGGSRRGNKSGGRPP